MKAKTRPHKNEDPSICLCNQVGQKKIEAAIARGCNTLPKIFDATSAGVGPCGGSCQPQLKKMLDYFMQTGTFLKNPHNTNSKK